jgi:integrase
MRWSDLSTETLAGLGEVLVYSIPGDRRKHGIPHALPLPPLAVEVLEALRPMTGKKQLVLDGWSRGRELWGWRKSLRRKVLDGLGVENFTRHDLRRSAASGMCRIGVSVHAADTVLGHGIKGSAKSYIHGARLLEAAGALWRWSDHLTQLTTGESAKIIRGSFPA